MTLTRLTTPLIVRGKVRVKVQDARVYFPTRATQRDSAPTTTTLPLHHTTSPYHYPTTTVVPQGAQDEELLHLVDGRKRCKLFRRHAASSGCILIGKTPWGFGVAVTVRVRLGLTSLMVAHSVIGLLVLLLVLLLGLLLGLGQHWRYLS